MRRTIKILGVETNKIRKK